MKRRKVKALDWLQEAAERVRKFAYAQPPASPAETVRPRVGVALGGGFARGIAHLGVLRVLEEEKIQVDFLSGTSAGSILAIAYAAGRPIREIEKQAAATRFRDFAQWRLSWLGLAANQRLEHYPRKFLGVTSFEQLRIPLTIAATNLKTGLPVYFDKGPLGPALRASCAYPGMFIPVEIEGQLLVDGFLSAPVPVEPLKQKGADIVIAVFLESESSRDPTSVVDVIGRSFAILQRHADLEWRREADIIIEPHVRDFLWDDFEKTPELILAGETAARATMPRIRALFESISTGKVRGTGKP